MLRPRFQNLPQRTAHLGRNEDVVVDLVFLIFSSATLTYFQYKIYSKFHFSPDLNIETNGGKRKLAYMRSERNLYSEYICIICLQGRFILAVLFR